MNEERTRRTNGPPVHVLLAWVLLLIPPVASAQTRSTGALWIRNWSGAGRSNDSIAATVMDRAGNLYVTGAGSRSGESLDFVTARYGPDGTEQWRSYYAGQAHRNDGAVALVLDNSGNVIVTGTSVESGTAGRITTIKYNGTTGAEVWRSSCRRGTPGLADDGASGLAYDSVSNRLYACGTMNGGVTDEDYFLIRYDPGTGDTIWTRAWDGGDSLDDHCVGLTLAGTGAGREPVLAGYYWHDVFEVYDWAIVQCSTATGRPAWVRRLDWDFGSDNEEPVGCCSDANGNVWVTGYRYNDGLGLYIAATAKISNHGARVDTQTTIRGDGDGWGVQCAYANGRVYVIGSFYDAVWLGHSREDWGVQAFDTISGSSRHLTMIWERYFDGGLGAFTDGNSHVFEEPEERPLERPTGMTVDALGRLYVCGYMIRPDRRQYWHVRRFGSASVPDTTFAIWFRQDTIAARPRSVAVWDTEHIYVAGFTTQCDSYPAGRAEQTVVRFGSGFQSIVVDSMKPVVDTVDSAVEWFSHPTVWLHNNGSLVAFPIERLFVGTEDFDRASCPRPVFPGQTDSIRTGVNLTRWLGPALNGVFPVHCTLEVAGDTSPRNNVIWDTTFDRVRNIEAIRIVAPTGSVTQGQIVTPRVWLRNRGNTKRPVSVRFTIAGGYSCTLTDTDLAPRGTPGDSQVVSFDAWTADSLGTRATKCTTMEVGDTWPSTRANNSIAGSVIVLPRQGITDAAADSGPPRSFALHGPLPNPASGLIRISYDLPSAGVLVRLPAHLGVYDLRGRLCREIANAKQPSGHYQFLWDRTDGRSRRLPAGVYFVRLRAGTFRATVELMLIE